MSEKDDMEYNLNEDIFQKDTKWPKKAKTLIIILASICFALAAALIVMIILNAKGSSNNSNPEPKRNESNNGSQIIDLFNFFGVKYPNLTYDDNGKIENTFKKGGDNYNESMGEINDGKDYEKNDRNIYDLYIPQYALDRKNDTNGIILWIHGGAWVHGVKDGMDIFCKLFSQQGYISATVGYTLLYSQNKVFNIFKMLDEITACIKAIKKELIKKGFAADKLKLVIGGYSAGGHLTLLYSYLIKKVDIPIEFIISFAGPVGLYPKYFQKLKSNNDNFTSIENITIIEQAMKDGKLEPTFSNPMILLFMNGFFGNKYDNDTLQKMLDSNGQINENNDKYKEMIKVIKFSFIPEIEDNNVKTPIICFYGGVDNVVGVTAYAYLKQKADKDGRQLDLIYSRNEAHDLILPTKPDGIQKLQEVISLIMRYSKKYFGY